MSIADNNLLESLRQQDRDLLTAHLHEMEFSAGSPLCRLGDIVSAAYFPTGAAIASFFVDMDDGMAIETAMIGREGAVGGIVSQGRLAAYATASVVHGGRFLKIRIADLEAAKQQSPALRRLFARYADCLLAQIFQSVACNAAHKLERRAAKWLVASFERTGTEHITMTQEQFASLLGVGRSYASRQIQRFKADGLLATMRGGLIVKDPDGLRARACTCNEHVKAHFEDVLQGVYPDENDMS
jgi:CRP-like cAMP-binding protein